MLKHTFLVSFYIVQEGKISGVFSLEDEQYIEGDVILLNRHLNRQIKHLSA
jgi:hypothetical protein